VVKNINFIETQWTRQSLSSLDKYLKEMSEDSYKEFSQKLIPNCNNMLGIRIPILRDIAKQIAKGDWRSFVSSVNDEDQYFETVMLHGFVLGYAKVNCDERLEYLKNFIPRIDNWSVCDCTCSGFKFVKKNREEVLEFLKAYINSDKEFEVRFAVVMLMDYFIIDEYIDMVLDVIRDIKYDGYYVKMAAAWAICVCFVKYQEKTMELICSQSFDDKTFNMALQKIVESNRVDEQTKAQLRILKKNRNKYTIEKYCFGQQLL